MKLRNCYVTDVGIAIEKLADALDPQRTKPFKGDILDLLEWAEKDVLEMRAENEKARAEVAQVKEVEFPRKVAMVAENWRKKLDAKDVEIAELRQRIEGIKEQRDTERAAYLNEFEKNQVIVAENARLRQQVTLLRDFATKISKQIPGKPDHYTPCYQCEQNSSEAEDIIEALTATKEQ